MPVVEPGAEFGRDGLGFLGAVVVAQAVVGEAECLGEHPAVVPLTPCPLSPPFIGARGFRYGFNPSITMRGSWPPTMGEPA